MIERLALPQMPSWRAIRGAFGRHRRALRRRILEPVLVGRPTLRDTVMNALAARGHLVFCDLGDVRFFVDPGDRVVGAWLMWHGGWQRREIDRAISVLSAAGRLAPDAVLVDVGANIGTHTVYAMRTGRFARAVAFEPEPRNARLLAMNLEANGLAASTLVVPKAAGARSGTAVLHLHPRNKGAHALDAPPSLDGRDAIEVAVVRVDDALDELDIRPEQVGLVWIDAEGYEPQVLAGLGRLLERAVPIAFEFAPQRYSLETKRTLVDLLARHYTAMHRLTGAADNRAGIEALASIDSIDDVLVF
jgi:FkbM family methyltransferase